MIKKKLLIFLAAIILALGLYAVPAFADKGSSDSSSGDSANTVSTSNDGTSGGSGDSSSTSSSQDTTQQEQETNIEQEANQQAKQETEDSLTTEADSIVNDMLKDHGKHSESDRQKNCQSAQHGLETKLSNLSKNATRFQTKIDTALALAISFQKDNNITVANFDQLVATAQAAQAKSAASVSALNALSPTLDCAQNTVATNVAEFKAAAKQARTDLLAYKDAVKAILVALESAKEGN